MFVPIPIPISVKRIAVVQGTVWKFVGCASCQQEFAYLLQLEGTGEDHDYLLLDTEGSKQRAQSRAEHNITQKGRNVVLPIPCPNCGTYQDDMVRLLKEDRASNVPLIAGLVVALISLMPLAFSIPNLWIVTVVGVLVGLCIIAYGDIAASRFDPNAVDVEYRKALGRKHAVWGEPLTELRALHSLVEPTDSTASRSG